MLCKLCGSPIHHPVKRWWSRKRQAMVLCLESRWQHVGGDGPWRLRWQHKAVPDG